MSRARPRIPLGVILTALVVVVLIPYVVPDRWLPAEKMKHDLVLAGVMVVVLAAIVGGWLLFGRSDDE